MVEDDLNTTPQSDFPEKTETKRVSFLWLKNVFVFLVLIGVVVASFWISFQLGKRILTPANKLPPPRIDVAIPEPPPSIMAMQKLQEIISSEAKAEVRVPKVEKRAARVRRAPVTVSSGESHYYKIEAGLYGVDSQAKELADQVKAAGFDVFVKKVNSSWRVQAGAFKTRDEATAVSEELFKKGFKSKVIYE